MVNATVNARDRPASMTFFALAYAQWTCTSVDILFVSKLISNAHSTLQTRLSILTNLWRNTREKISMEAALLTYHIKACSHSQNVTESEGETV